MPVAGVFCKLRSVFVARTPIPFRSSAACTVKAVIVLAAAYASTLRENRPPFDIIHPPPWEIVSKLLHQKLVARILSHFADPGVISKRSPIRGSAVQIRCDPIDAIGSPPPMASPHSPPKRNPQKTPYTKSCLRQYSEGEQAAIRYHTSATLGNS
jgi:hypothetical protein